MSFPTDMDGFLSQECPSCEQRFKIVFGQGSEEPISYCPYCGYNGRECWHTQEQVDYMQVVAANTALAPELRKLERELKGMSNEFLKIDVKSDLTESPLPPMETDDAFDMLHFPCCNETIKVTRNERYFCTICGTEVDMTINDAKKVFLSHRGVDKEQVIDFKKTLELLGYNPWVDEDAMPAGTLLERGLLQGMQESCGVVFFITPSFKDEGYLETEINYAIQEKRKKGNKFAIITLQFVDDGGNVGAIPELLKTYVWKKPRTLLEALREIVRGLPMVTGIVDWRDDTIGVVTMPRTKSTATELSDEARSILQVAATGDGHIMHIRYMGGEEIQTNGKCLIPVQDPRTIARWVGGLEDLQRRRYIKDLGHKGEVFEVTREGYEAADELSDT
ncbi:MAG: toll/interleukin-1 receptor domain-containing protein [Planctomycetota bacterium]